MYFPGISISKRGKWFVIPGLNVTRSILHEKDVIPIWPRVYQSDCFVLRKWSP